MFVSLTVMVSDFFACESRVPYSERTKCFHFRTHWIKIWSSESLGLIPKIVNKSLNGPLNWYINGLFVKFSTVTTGHLRGPWKWFIILYLSVLCCCFFFCKMIIGHKWPVKYSEIDKKNLKFSWLKLNLIFGFVEHTTTTLGQYFWGQSQFPY